MPQEFFEVVWLFLIYAFIGWCVEVAYQTVNHGVFINRGFLNGPYCPIYGCGGVLCVWVLYPLHENTVLLFFGSAIFASLLELITGFVLEKVFHNKWWDYSNVPFNIKGYVCLKFSLYWGLAGMVALDIFHPIIYWFVTLIPDTLAIVLACIMMTGFTVDFIITVATIKHFNQRLKIMDDMAKRIHKLSDSIGEQVFESTELVIEKSEEFKENHGELLDRIDEAKDATKGKMDATKEAAMERMEATKAELEELQQKYEELFTKRTLGMRRLMKAFPGMKSEASQEALDAMKEYFHIGTLREKGKELAKKALKDKE